MSDGKSTESRNPRRSKSRRRRDRKPYKGAKKRHTQFTNDSIKNQLKALGLVPDAKNHQETKSVSEGTDSGADESGQAP